jgi:hypothetical protein
MIWRMHELPLTGFQRVIGFEFPHIEVFCFEMGFSDRPLNASLQSWQIIFRRNILPSSARSKSEPWKHKVLSYNDYKKIVTIGF